MTDARVWKTVEFPGANAGMMTAHSSRVEIPTALSLEREVSLSGGTFYRG